MLKTPEKTVHTNEYFMNGEIDVISKNIIPPVKNKNRSNSNLLPLAPNICVMLFFNNAFLILCFKYKNNNTAIVAAIMP